MLELSIPIRVAVAFARLAIGLKAVAHIIEQLADQRAADLMTLRLKLLRQPAHALARPEQRRLRIAARGRLNQRAEIRKQRRILRNMPLAPTTAAPNAIQFARPRQFSQATPNRARSNPRRHRHRRDPAIARGRCLRRRNHTPTALVQERRYRRKSLPDRLDINHHHTIWYSCPLENPTSTNQQIPIRLFSDRP